LVVVRFAATVTRHVLAALSAAESRSSDAEA
jgi:hypothetical protein